MRFNINTYKEKYHFSMNFYSLFLLFTFIPDIIHVSPGIFKYGFWAIKMVLASWLIYKTRRTFFNLNTYEYLFLMVFIIYGANIYANVFLNPLPILNYSTGLMDFIGFVIMLVLAFAFRYDEAYHSKKSLDFFIVSLTIGLVMAYFMAIANDKLDNHNTRFDANSTVNTINYGQMGSALALVSLYCFTNCRKLFLKFVYAGVFLIGLISIAKAGSRSPVVVLGIVGMIYFVAKMGTVRGFFLISICAVLLAFSYQAIVSILEAMGSTIATRIQSAIVDQETSGRDEIWQNTLNIINNSPYFGKYYIIPTGRGAGAYPHNFFLEAFMTTGFFGGVPFTILVLVSISKSYKLLKANHPASWIVLLYLQLVVFGNFSTGLYTSQDFWILLFFVFSIHSAGKKITQPFTVQPVAVKKKPRVKVPELVDQH